MARGRGWKGLNSWGGAATDLSYLPSNSLGCVHLLTPHGRGRGWPSHHARPGEQVPRAGCSKLPFLRLQRWRPCTQDKLPGALPGVVIQGGRGALQASPPAQIPLSGVVPASSQVLVAARSGCLSAGLDRVSLLFCPCSLEGLASSSTSAFLMVRRMSELE